MNQEVEREMICPLIQCLMLMLFCKDSEVRTNC